VAGYIAAPRACDVIAGSIVGGLGASARRREASSLAALSLPWIVAASAVTWRLVGAGGAAAAAAGGFCTSCGKPVPGGAKFCPSCGAQQAAPGCPGCGKPVPEGAKFCPGCGTKLGG
jgi:RNA polymerase subunit RPABC4/transcription elongation factor Spt4